MYLMTHGAEFFKQPPVRGRVAISPRRTDRKPYKNNFHLCSYLKIHEVGFTAASLLVRRLAVYSNHFAFHLQDIFQLLCPMLVGVDVQCLLQCSLADSLRPWLIQRR